MFTIQLNGHAQIFQDLLDLYYPKRSGKEPLKVIDFTFGSGSLWWDVFEKPCTCCGGPHVKLTKTDACPPLAKWREEIRIRQQKIKEAVEAKKDQEIITAMGKDLAAVKKKRPPDKDVFKKNLLSSDYSDLGRHDLGVFDPPCLLGKRTAFDYKHKDQYRITSSHIVSQALQGPRSWGATQIEKFTNNPTLDDFDDRLIGLNRRAPTVLSPGARLICKIFEPRHDGKLVKLGERCKQFLTNFEFEDEFIYVRQGATTFKMHGHPQNLHGFYLTFLLKKKEKEVNL